MRDGEPVSTLPGQPQRRVNWQPCVTCELALLLGIAVIAASADQGPTGAPAATPGERVISLHPLIIEAPNFASPEEIASVSGLLERCKVGDWSECKLVHSGLARKAENATISSNDPPLRKSMSFQLTLPGELEPTIDRLVRRAHLFARHPITFGEGVQVASYGAGEYYGFHHDGLHRRATFLLYLTDASPGDGGDTIFPLVRAPGIPDDAPPPLPVAITGTQRSRLGFKMNRTELIGPYCESDYYLRVRPVMGKAILFFSYRPDQSMDEYAYHAACPVLNGHKAILQRWMRFDPNSLMEKGGDEVLAARVNLGHGRLIPPGELPGEVPAQDVLADIAERLARRTAVRDAGAAAPDGTVEHPLRPSEDANVAQSIGGRVDGTSGSSGELSSGTADARVTVEAGAAATDGVSVTRSSLESDDSTPAGRMPEDIEL
eukprot:NODE_8676_length_1477_cov_6.843704.p1 GENE.NODE_8676_length_1477_cov_6.843704~~NODE_8676_length_1477_cov_6.843704.p1  ORF type:complete len:433 (-),score=110.54 NODE_8676_length_1477_cov_6.843704:25-1323(-)